MVAATARPPVTLGRQLGKHLGRLVFALVVGVVFLVASLPKGTTALSRQDGWEWLAEPANASSWLDKSLAGIPDLLTWLGYALLAYLGALLLISIRHWRLGLFAFGVAVATLTAALPLLFGVLVFKVGAFLADVLFAVFGFFGDIARGLRDFTVFVFSSWWWIVPAVVVAGLLVMGRGTAKKWIKPVAIGLAVIAAIAAALIGLVLLAGLVPESFWVEARRVVGVVIQVLLVSLAIATVGQLFVDQLRSTMIAGGDRNGVVMGAIAVGSALAMLMLIGNILNAYAWYPDVMANWLRLHLQSNGAPNLDTVVALVVVSLSAIGVLRSLGRMRPAPDMADFRRSLIYAIFGTLFTVAIASVAKQTER